MRLRRHYLLDDQALPGRPHSGMGEQFPFGGDAEGGCRSPPSRTCAWWRTVFAPRPSADAAAWRTSDICETRTERVIQPAARPSGAACRRRATMSPAPHPGARPCAGRRIAGTSKPALASSHAMMELEFHISPALSSSRPHTGVGRRGPATDLVAEHPQAAGPPAPYGAAGDDSPPPSLSVGHWRALDGVLALGEAHHERRVIEVARWTALDQCDEALVDPAVQAHHVAAGPQRQPVEVDRRAAHASAATARLAARAIPRMMIGCSMEPPRAGRDRAVRSSHPGRRSSHPRRVRRPPRRPCRPAWSLR